MDMINRVVLAVGFVLIIIETRLINKSKTKIACRMAVAQFLIILARFLWIVHTQSTGMYFGVLDSLEFMITNLFFLPVFGAWAVALIAISRKEDD